MESATQAQSSADPNINKYPGGPLKAGEVLQTQTDNVMQKRPYPSLSSQADDRASSSSKTHKESMHMADESAGNASNSSLKYKPKVTDLSVERITFEEPIVSDMPEPPPKKLKTGIYTVDEGPTFYHIKGDLVTPPLIAKNLPKEFESLPIFGGPKSKADLPEFNRNKMRDFIGRNLSDEEFDNLSEYCSPSHLKTGEELKMPTQFPVHGIVAEKHVEKLTLEKAGAVDGIKLITHKKHQMRVEKDVANIYQLKLKYRGVRLLPLSAEEDKSPTSTALLGQRLEPGKDLIFRVRIYRPFSYSIKNNTKQPGRTRHSVLSCDVVLAGRQTLAQLRDRLVCANDVGMRVDVSDHPDDLPPTSAKDVFPSGFLFINNVFYVDSRPGCSDLSKVVRDWAKQRRLGDFPVRDMCSVQLDEIVLKLGHPEVYVHQGNCEHLLTFAEARLAAPADPARLAAYPAHTAASQYQSVYCTTCAEFGAKWVVVQCARVPFDPAFFCDTCFKSYLYLDGQKIGDFKAYSYRGNEINMLKPLG